MCIYIYIWHENLIINQVKQSLPSVQGGVESGVEETEPNSSETEGYKLILSPTLPADNRLNVSRLLISVYI